MARKHAKSPGAHKSHQHIQLRGKLLALEQLLHLIGEAGILIGRRSLLTHEHTHTKSSTNNTMKIVSSRPNLSLSFFSRSLQPGIQKLQITATEKKSTRTLKKPPDIVDVCSLKMKQRGRRESSRTQRAREEGRGRQKRKRESARAKEREERRSAAARNTKLHALRIMNTKLFPSWMRITLRGCVSSVYCSKLLFASWMRNTHFFVDEDTLSGDAFHLFIVVSPSSLPTFIISLCRCFSFKNSINVYSSGICIKKNFIQNLHKCIFI